MFSGRNISALTFRIHKLTPEAPKMRCTRHNSSCHFGVLAKWAQVEFRVAQTHRTESTKCRLRRNIVKHPVAAPSHARFLAAPCTFPTGAAAAAATPSLSFWRSTHALIRRELFPPKIHFSTGQCSYSFSRARPALIALSQWNVRSALHKTTSPRCGLYISQHWANR